MKLLSLRNLILVQSYSASPLSIVFPSSRRRLLSTALRASVGDNAISYDEIIELPSEKILSPEEFRKQHQINLKGVKTGDFNPMMDFSSTPFFPSIRKILQLEGFNAPTPTQSQSWPIALSKRDIISVARTGSGKTCGFLLPAFHNIMLRQQEMAGTRQKSPRHKSPTVLVLAPTRELTAQIDEQACKFARTAGVYTACVYGGSAKGPQISQLRQGVDIVIATPGRCFDLFDMGVLDLSNINYVVLDEADRMLDMGFEPQIREIFEQLPEEKQCLFFTATWPKEIQSLAAEFLRNPVQLSIGDNDVLNANKAITQNIHIVRGHEKQQALETILNDLKLPTTTTTTNSTHPHGAKSVAKTIIFVSRKNQCEEVADSLYHLGYAVDTLHGDKTQIMRTKTMDKFRQGRIQLLVATDVAARGLDVKDVEAVINYDFPNNVEDYVHRIGRTARGSNSGQAHTLFTAGDADHASELIGVMQRCDQKIPQELLSMVPSRGGGGRGSFGQRGGGRGGSRNGGGGGGGRSSFGRSSSSFGSSNSGGGRGGGSGYGGSRSSRPAYGDRENPVASRPSAGGYGYSRDQAAAATSGSRYGGGNSRSTGGYGNTASSSGSSSTRRNARQNRDDFDDFF